MKYETKLSLMTAIFININIMIGAGLFINTSNIAQMAGAAGFVAYALLALLLYPLIACIAQLVSLFPSGGFYSYAATLHPLLGFISAWSYFVSKLASATILMHASILLLQQIIPALANINIFILDISILLLFWFLNLFHLKMGTTIQLFFLILKSIPILFVTCMGLYLFDPGNYNQNAFVWNNIIDTLPFVLYAAIGFEATTSLSSKIVDAHKNGPRAIIISYILVMCINILYQFFFYGALGTILTEKTSFLQAFPALIANYFGEQGTLYLQSILNITIASSALGGTYGILFSNSWNLYTLAQEHLLHASTFFLQKNRYAIAHWCITSEIIICLFYLMLTKGSQIPLQQLAVFGCTIAYSLSILSLLWILYKKGASLIIPLCALLNCCIFLLSCIYSFMYKGYMSLFLLGYLLAIGLWIYKPTTPKSSPASNA